MHHLFTSCCRYTLALFKLRLAYQATATKRPLRSVESASKARPNRFDIGLPLETESTERTEDTNETETVEDSWSSVLLRSRCVTPRSGKDCALCRKSSKIDVHYTVDFATIRKPIVRSGDRAISDRDLGLKKNDPVPRCSGPMSSYVTLTSRNSFL